LKEASTFRRARGLSPYPAISYPDPYFQSITYDAFDHSNRTGKLYTGEPSDVGTYVNNRRTGWTYDADGNNTSNLSYQQTIDAAGKTIRSVSTANVGDGVQYPYEPRLDITQTYDGAGEPAKRVQISRLPGIVDEFGTPGEPIEDTQTTHYIKSTVLGGATVAELGWGDTIHVYAGAQRIAREFLGNVTFEHRNPTTGSWVTSHGHSSYRTTNREERDPRGAETPLANPYGAAANYLEWKFSQPLFIEGGDPFDYVSGYTKDGLPMTRGDLGRILGKLGPTGFLLFDVYRFPKAIVYAGEHENYWSEFFVGIGWLNLNQRESQWKRFKLPPLRLPKAEPQNRGPLTSDQIEAISEEIGLLLTDKCATFINQIVRGITGKSYDSKKQLLDDFNKVRNGKGFTWGGMRGGSQGGNLAAGTADIQINSMYFFIDKKYVEGAASVTLHELIHAITGVGDIPLSNLVKELGIEVMNYPGHTATFPTDPKDDLAHSGYWGQALKNNCSRRGY
jgi:hypothetical protein